MISLICLPQARFAFWFNRIWTIEIVWWSKTSQLMARRFVSCVRFAPSFVIRLNGTDLNGRVGRDETISISRQDLYLLLKNPVRSMCSIVRHHAETSSNVHVPKGFKNAAECSNGLVLSVASGSAYNKWFNTPLPSREKLRKYTSYYLITTTIVFYRVSLVMPSLEAGSNHTKEGWVWVKFTPV